MAILLHKYISSWFSIFFNSISLIMNWTCANMSKANIMQYVNNSFTLYESVYIV